MTSTTTPATIHEAVLAELNPAEGHCGIRWHQVAEYDGETIWVVAPGETDHGLNCTIRFNHGDVVEVTRWAPNGWDVAWTVKVGPDMPRALAARYVELAWTHAVMEEYGRR